MKESLKFLGVESSGLTDTNKHPKRSPFSDEELYLKAKDFQDPIKAQEFIEDSFENYGSANYRKVKIYLAELVKDKDLDYASQLIVSLSHESPMDPEPYLLFSEIALENNAFIIAKHSAEISMWLSYKIDFYTEIYSKAKTHYDTISEKIKSGETDNSLNAQWDDKLIPRSCIINRISHLISPKKCFEYYFNLLTLFPNEEENYIFVLKALDKLENNIFFKDIINLIDTNFHDNSLKAKFYSGIALFYSGLYDESIKNLDAVIQEEQENITAKIYLALNYLLTNKLKDFVIFTASIHPEADFLYCAIYYIACAASNAKLKKDESIGHKIIAEEISMIIDKLIQNKEFDIVTYLLSQFTKLEFNLILPLWQLYVSEVLIKRNMLEVAKTVLKECSDSESSRLMAWIYRLEGKKDLAEVELAKYRANSPPEKDKGISCKSLRLELPEKSPDSEEEILNSLETAYKQTKKIITDLEIEYGVDTSTCIETGCQDCCKNTFPFITYTEYLYIRKWLNEQSDEFKNSLIQKCNKIVEDYKSRFNRMPPFLVEATDDKIKVHPFGFKFDCPYLGDNKCGIYEVRPFTCRSYGFSTGDGVSLRGCAYFFEQFRSVTKLYPERKVLNENSFYVFVEKTDKKLIGKSVMAPIPVWFAQSHEETLKKVQEAIKDSETMT